MKNRDTVQQDVVVVGAGPVGLVTALLLADAGVKTTVIEKSTQPGDLPRAISLQDESFRIFEQLGIADALKRESLTDTGSRYFGVDNVLLAEARPVPSRIGHPAKSQFDQPDLEKLLFDRATAHPCLEMRLGTEAVGLFQDTEGVALEIDRGKGSETLTARYVIGADGGRSFIRSAVGVKMLGSTQPQRWIVIDTHNDHVQRELFAEFHCDGKRPYVLVPGANGRLRLEFMLFDGEDQDAMTTPEAVRELMRSIRPEMQDDDVRRAAVYVAHQRVAESYRAGRVFLVGDAAHLMPPFAGQGLNAGVRDGSNIAWKLIEALRGGASERLLDSYDIERREHGRKMMRTSQRIGAVVMATNPWATRLRDKIVLALRKAPTMHSYLVNMRFITPPDYSKGLAVDSPSLARVLPAMQVGRSLAQPRVAEVATCEIQPLDDFLRTGWSVLALGGANLRCLDPYFTRIGARKVRLDGPQHPACEVDTSADAHVQETDPVLTAGTTGEPVFVLVRPDRYVAAAFTAEEQERTVTSLRNFVDDRLRAARKS